MRRVLLLGVRGGRAPAGGLRDRAPVAGEEQRGEREHDLDSGAHQAVPQVLKADREEHRVHAHDVLAVQARVLLDVPRRVGHSRRAHRGVLRLQPLRARQVERRAHFFRGGEEARGGEALAGAVHALLRAVGGARRFAAQGGGRSRGVGDAKAASARRSAEHAALAASVHRGRAGADRGVPPRAEVDVRVRVLPLRGGRERQEALLRVCAGGRRGNARAPH
mmetsp:Transcript_2122/g.8811  ORF Transcript_2122/g.8811 Transcript_2122/m.8811 type:complete len:221 (+) Transcript_2122:809-1471(+)